MSGFKPAGLHKEKRLTAAAVKNLGPGFHADGHGLYLKVDCNGSKRWVQRIVIQGKRRDLGLGSASLVSLLEAREAALQHRKAARAGDDPLAAKKRSTATPTFEEAARLVYDHNEITWSNPKHKKQWLSTLTSYAFPFFGSKRINEINSGEITIALDQIWLTHPTTASRVMQRVSKVFDWAVARDYRPTNPTAGIKEGLAKHTKKPIKHRRALPYGEVAGAINKIKDSKAFSATKLSFELLIHTATRSKEIREAVWSEFDLVSNTWIIPGNRMKAGIQHRVPLTDATKAILEKAKALRQPDCDLVFPNSKGKAFSDSTLSKLTRELGIAAVPHGFRSSFRDWAAETTRYSDRDIEFALAHLIPDKAEAAYARSDLLERRRPLMAEWSDFLTAEQKPQSETVS